MANVAEITPASPYYLHPNENPAVALVQPPLVGNNYQSWCRAMKMALLSKNKLQFINGTLPMPAPADRCYLIWNQCNNMVLSWLLNSLSLSIKQSVLWIDTAKEVWDDLHERFNNGDMFRLSDLMEEIGTTRQGNSSITEYYTQLKILWDELAVLRPVPPCSCVPKCHCNLIPTIQGYNDAECVIRFLKGLNEEYSNIKSQVLLMNHMPSVKKVFSMAIKHERQTNHNVEFQNESNVMAARGNFRPDGNRYSTAYGQKKPQCTFCGFQGHTVDRCYRKHGFPPGFKPKPRGSINMSQYEEEDQYEQVEQMQPVDKVQAPSISQAQYEHLIKLLQSSMPSSSAPKEIIAGNVHEPATVMSAQTSIEPPLTWNGKLSMTADAGAQSAAWNADANAQSSTWNGPPDWEDDWLS